MPDPLTWDEVRPGGGSTPLLAAGLEGIGGTLTTSPSDFRVEEILPYEPSGSGDHYFVCVRKTLMSTVDAARTLAHSVGVSVRDVGFAGRKDVHSIATQWFSLPKPPKPLATEKLEILQAIPHPKKLKNGHVRANRFEVTIRNVQPDASSSLPALLSRLANGHPNYFGCQRFGKNGRNLLDVLRWIDRDCPRMKNARFLVSALQSAVFNVWLGQRLQLEGLETAILGDILRKRDTGGLFLCDDIETDSRRLASGALDLCGPLFGPKMKPASGKAATREDVFVDRLALTEGASRNVGRLGAGGRRPSRVLAADITHAIKGGDLNIAFTLPSGAYATVFLAELMQPNAGWVERASVKP